MYIIRTILINHDDRIVPCEVCNCDLSAISDDILEEMMYANTTFKKLYQWQLSIKKGKYISIYRLYVA